MGSNMNHLQMLEHHYQDPERPFGFIFDHSDEPEAPVPEAPAAGEPLLNDVELTHTNQFFDRLQNDLDFWDDSKLLDSFSSFSNDSLPTFQGISVTLPQSAHSLDSPIQNLDFTHFGHDLTARFGQTQLVSPTATEHSSLQNLDHFSLSQQTHSDGLSPKHHTPQVFKTLELFEQTQELRNAASRVAGVSGGVSKSSRTTLRKSSSGQSGIASNALGGPAEDTQRRPLPSVSFGSDLDFHSQQYNSSKSHHIDLKNREAIFQENLKTFESKWSGESTASSSPITATKHNLSHVNGVAAALFPAANGNARRRSDHALEDEGSKRAKKMKHEDADGGTDDSNSGSAPQTATLARQISWGKSKTQKRKSRTLSESKSTVGVSRRKSGGAAAAAAAAAADAAADATDSKTPRQNLTEEEKKLNHIRSEQKRRNQITQGFTDLTKMMPDASSANLSKCAILAHAVDWLSGLIEGNEKLRAQLAGLNA